MCYESQEPFTACRGDSLAAMKSEQKSDTHLTKLEIGCSMTQYDAVSLCYDEVPLHKHATRTRISWRPATKAPLVCHELFVPFVTYILRWKTHLHHEPKIHTTNHCRVILSLRGTSLSSSGSASAFFGVLDGHGGKKAAWRLCAAQLSCASQDVMPVVYTYLCIPYADLYLSRKYTYIYICISKNNKYISTHNYIYRRTFTLSRNPLSHVTEVSFAYLGLQPKASSSFQPRKRS